MNVHTGSITAQATYSVPAPTTTRGASTKLGASADGLSISYGSGRTAVVRSLAPGGASLLFGHAAPVTVTKIISPYYAASGDSAGNLKVWSTTGNYSVKLESKPIARINDIAYDGEGKRLVVVGDGKSSFGATFSLDTGSGIGEISGHTKIINAVAMRPIRPFRAVTASDDFTTVVSNGVPFKFASQQRRHTRFVQGVDYALDGSLFVSAGSDAQVLLYDGTTGEEKGALLDGEAAHGAGVYAASFSRDSKSIATSSADGKVKLWDVASNQVVQTWTFEGDALQSQQVGNVWAGETIVSLSFSGDLNLLDPRTATPTSILYGHQSPITAVARASTDSETFFSGDSTGRVLQVGSDGVTEPVSGGNHSGLVVDIVPSGDAFYSASWDDTVRRLRPTSGFDSSAIAAGGQPKGLASVGSFVFLASSNDVQVLVDGVKTSSLPIESPLAIAASGDGTRVAVAVEAQVSIYDASSKELKLIGSAELRSPPSALAFSPDGKLLAVGLSTGKIPLYDVSASEPKLVHSRWTDCTARINSLAFNPAGTHLAAASLDESVRVFSTLKPSNVLALKNAHRGGVASVVWSNDSRLVTGGADGVLAALEVKLA